MARSNARFIYSGYWKRWALILTETCNARPGYGPFVEIDLQPINGWDRAGAEKTLNLNVRRHCTMPELNDRFANELPADVLAEVRDNMGADLADWLLDPSTEILGKIDWQRFRDVCNGGASLYDIVHERYLEQLPAQVVTLPMAA